MGPILSIILAVVAAPTALLQQVVTAPPLQPSTVFHFIDRHEAAAFQLLDQDGEVDADSLRALSHFVRCRRTGKEKLLHPRLVEIVRAASLHFSSQQVDVISGVRARPFGAPHSKHFIGRAMDITLPGVSPKVLAAWVWHNFHGIGVGYYPNQSFVHVDVRDEDVRWIDNSNHGEGSHARYIGRAPSDVLQPDAPVLAYDQTRRQILPLTAASHLTQQALALHVAP